MTTPTVELNTAFSEPDAAAVPWTEVEQVLAGTEMYFLSTVRADGRPHVTPLPAIWDQGVLHICTGDQEQKAKNLAALWKSRLDWDFEVGEDAFRDPDGRNGLVYGISPAKVLAFGKGPYTRTRYRFGSAEDLA